MHRYRGAYRRKWSEEVDAERARCPASNGTSGIDDLLRREITATDKSESPCVANGGDKFGRIASTCERRLDDRVVQLKTAKEIVACVSPLFEGR